MATTTIDKQRLGFAYYLLADKDFLYHDQLISGIALEVGYRIYDLDGNELFFTEEQVANQHFDFDGTTLKIRDIIQCHYVSDGKIEFVRDVESLEVLQDYVITYEAIEYFEILEREKSGIRYLVNAKIPFEVFTNILEGYSSNFKAQENKPLIISHAFSIDGNKVL